MPQLIETLHYIPEGRWFDYGWSKFSLTAALRSTHPLTEMSTKGISWGVKAAGA
jgi:hypothetical protein